MTAHPSHRLKVIAGVMTAIFLCQEIAWAAPGGIETLGAPAATVAVPPPLGIGGFIANPGQLNIPFDAVTLQEIHSGTNGRLIIHIQDAHANLSGQQSLAKAVEHFVTKYGIKTVLVEGADRDVTLDPIRKLAPLSEWKIIARRFLYEGIISGEEYLNLTSDQPMKLRGVEYRDLYNDAVRAYASLVDRRKDILHYLYQAKVSLDRLKVRMYPRALLDYENKKSGVDPDLGEDFKDQTEGLFNLCQTAGMSLEKYPQMARLKELFEKEKSLDFDRANREQADVLSRVSPEEAKSFTEASRRLRTSQVSQYRLVRQLLDQAMSLQERKEPMSLRGREAPEAISQRSDSRSKAEQAEHSAFPALSEYADYLLKFLDLKMESLMAEQELLEDRVFEKLLPDDDARKVRAIDRFLGLLGNAYKLQMSSHDFKMFEFNEKDFPTESWLAFMNRKLADLGFFESMVPTKPYLEEARADFGKFYKLVGQRDEAFVQNAHKIMAEEKTNVALLIAGGYHTDHLTQLLRDEGTSYIVLTPLVTDKTDQAKYEATLLQQLKAQEKHLAASRSKINDMSQTGIGRAENVSATKIPRGIRTEAATARFAAGGLNGEMQVFLGSHMGAGAGSKIMKAAASRMSEVVPNSATEAIHRALSGGAPQPSPALPRIQPLSLSTILKGQTEKPPSEIELRIKSIERNDEKSAIALRTLDAIRTILLNTPELWNQDNQNIKEDLLRADIVVSDKYWSFATLWTFEDRPIILINSHYFEHLSSAMLTQVIGHEVGHLLLKNVGDTLKNMMATGIRINHKVFDSDFEDRCDMLGVYCVRRLYSSNKWDEILKLFEVGDEVIIKIGQMRAAMGGVINLDGGDCGSHRPVPDRVLFLKKLLEKYPNNLNKIIEDFLLKWEFQRAFLPVAPHLQPILTPPPALNDPSTRPADGDQIGGARTSAGARMAHLVGAESSLAVTMNAAARMAGLSHLQLAMSAALIVSLIFHALKNTAKMILAWKDRRYAEFDSIHGVLSWAAVAMSIYLLVTGSPLSRVNQVAAALSMITARWNSKWAQSVTMGLIAFSLFNDGQGVTPPVEAEPPSGVFALGARMAKHQRDLAEALKTFDGIKRQIQSDAELAAPSWNRGNAQERIQKFREWIAKYIGIQPKPSNDGAADFLRATQQLFCNF